MGDPASHSDFERSVLAAVIAGESVGEDSRPADDEARRVISGTLIRELVAGSHGQVRRVTIHGVVVEGGIDLGYLEWRGDLDLRHCRIKGTLNINHMVLQGRLQLDGVDVDRIEAEYAVVDGPFFLRDGRCRGGFPALGIRVSGSLNLRRSTLEASEKLTNNAAIGLFRARVGDIFLNPAFVYGGIYANGVTVDRNVRLQGSVIKSRPAMKWKTGSDTADSAISLQGATLGGALYLSWKDSQRRVGEVEGDVVLTRMSCASLHARPSELVAARLRVDHLTYQRLVGITPGEWLEILEGAQPESTQPYAQLAGYCDDLGRSDLARRVRIALERRLTSEVPRGSFERSRRRLWAWTAEYGYRPGRAIVWLLLTAVLCAVILKFAGGFLVHKSPTRGIDRGSPSWVQAASLSIDNLLPFAGLGVAKDWSADPRSLSELLWLFLFVALKFAAWGLAAVGLASVTGVLRRG